MRPSSVLPSDSPPPAELSTRRRRRRPTPPPAPRPSRRAALLAPPPRRPRRRLPPPRGSTAAGGRSRFSLLDASRARRGGAPGGRALALHLHRREVLPRHHHARPLAAQIADASPASSKARERRPALLADPMMYERIATLGRWAARTPRLDRRRVEAMLREAQMQLSSRARQTLSACTLVRRAAGGTAEHFSGTLAAATKQTESRRQRSYRHRSSGGCAQPDEAVISQSSELCPQLDWYPPC